MNEKLNDVVSAVSEAIAAVGDPPSGLLPYNRNAALLRLLAQVLIIEMTGMTVLKNTAEHGKSATVQGTGSVQQAEIARRRLG